jgi:membrane-associated phospholipid phosphatase
VVVLLLVAAVCIVAGSVAAAAVHVAPRSDPALSATRAIGEQIGRRRSLRGFLDSRLERGVATGLALTIGLLAAIAAGIGIGILIYMVRTQTGLVQVDRAVERWSDPRMTPASIAALRVLTAFGATATVVVLGVLTAAYGLWRWRSRAIPVFLAIVIVGQLVLSDLIKGAVQRTRPDLRPLAGFTGPSFPSGHTTAAAATFVAIAIVLGRDGTSRRRMLLAGTAIGLAVAVACSRVFLGVHWLTDVIGGLLLGWTWVALCAVAFGGHVMRFAAPARAAAATGPEPEPRFDEAIAGAGLSPTQRKEIP